MRFDVARPVDLMDNAAALPTTPQAHSHNRSGQFIWYLNRSIPIVGDRTPGPQTASYFLGITTANFLGITTANVAIKIDAFEVKDRRVWHARPHRSTPCGAQRRGKMEAVTGTTPPIEAWNHDHRI